ncbi:MAG TPA: hypothetical protein VFY49_11720 [Myxococcota bacterium]|nr:hypothetical protein [Myxococcota bacterium]
MSPTPQADADLGARLAALGQRLGEREASHAPGLDEARRQAETLRAQVAGALERFHAAASSAGAPHLRVALGDVRVDDKHVRAVEFDLVRGRHKAIVTAKSKGEVTLVGPFRAGKDEGPCLSFPFGARDELSRALASFLERFLEEAATP